MSPMGLLGIEIGGTKLQLGIGPGDGTLLALERLDVDPARRAAGIRKQIAAAFPALLAAAGLSPGSIIAAGVGFGGPVDTENGRTVRSYQVEGWKNFALADWVREKLGIPAVVLHNDADAAGLAESRFGAGKGYAPLLYMTVGSGIGGALIIGDRIFRGFGKGAGEIGHLRVPARGDAAPGQPADWTELELVASGWAIGRAGQTFVAANPDQALDEGWMFLDPYLIHDPSRVTGRTVADAARRGSPAARAIIVRAQTAIAFALSQAIALVAPQRIVIGGGVSLNGDAWFHEIRYFVSQLVFPPFRDGFDIVPAALGEEVVVHGAVALARDAASQRALP